MNRHYCFATINRYNPYGYLSSIARGDTEKDIWRLEEMNPRGQINRFALGNGTVSLSIYYLQTDHLGSLYAITGDDGRIVTQNGNEAVYSFDAWGRRRNPVNWSYEGLPSDFLIDRGFTFHEQLDEFGLINMNGRVYDPVIGRFLSPDNYVQGGFTQSFNRYSYCGNNPLNATDPSGEIFIGFITTLVGEFFKTGLTKGGFELWNWNKIYFQEAWADFDPGVEGNITNNAWKIDMGQLKVDENRTFAGQAFQIIARFSGELEQTMYGNMYSHLRNVSGDVDDVSYYGGATLVNKNDNSGERWGLTLGSYINSKNVDADPYKDRLFRHEYGHTLQSRLTGPLYVGHVGFPSLVGQELENLDLNNHSSEWYETQANRMSYRYLTNHAPGALDKLPWPSDSYEYPREYQLTWYWILANPPLPFAWWLLF
jgi:RHS repeat-associated protein